MTQTVLLGDLVDIKHGYAFKGEYFSNRGDKIVVTPGNFYDTGGFKYKSKEKYYTGEIPNGYVFRKNDLAIAMTEQMSGLLGSAIFIPEDDKFLHNQRIGLVTIKDSSRLDRNFLYYLFNSPDVRHQISAMATGTKIRHTSPGSIYKVGIFLPTLQEQIFIGETLRALDEKITLNRTINETLEQMGQALFRHYFVNDPEAKKIKLEDIATLVRGIEPGSKNYTSELSQDNVAFLRVGDLSQRSSNLYVAIDLTKGKIATTNDVLVSFDGAPGLVCVGLEGCYSSGIRKITSRGNGITNSYLYFLMKSDEVQDIIERYSEGTTIKHASRSIPHIEAPYVAGSEAYVLLDAITGQIISSLGQISVLTKLRDSLLPRLISGKIKL